MIKNLKTQQTRFHFQIDSVNILHILSAIVLFFLLVILGITLNLQLMVEEKDEYISNMYSNTKYYSVKDNLYDPDQFYTYRQNGDNINKLGQFYNALISSEKFNFISSFTQPIPIENFSGHQQFLYNSQEFIDSNSNMILNVKSIQLNHTSFDHYGLKTEDSQQLNWNEVDYKSGHVPILLGSNYQKIYKINDKLKGNFYGNSVEFTVQGFLIPNTFIHYKGNTEFYLDDYIVLPYPNQCETVDAKDFEFEGILYFAMINGEIVSKTSEKELISEIKRISDSTRFIDFSIIGLPEISVQYRELLSLINENQKLLYFSLIFIIILVFVIQFGIGQMMIKRRKELYKSYWIIGYSSYFKYYIYDLGISYFVAFISCHIALILCFQNINVMVLGKILLVSLAIFIITYLSCRQSLAKAVRCNI